MRRKTATGFRDLLLQMQHHPLFDVGTQCRCAQRPSHADRQALHGLQLAFFLYARALVVAQHREHFSRRLGHGVTQTSDAVLAHLIAVGEDSQCQSHGRRDPADVRSRCQARYHSLGQPLQHAEPESQAWR